jgi:predicted DNA-binding protein
LLFLIPKERGGIPLLCLKSKGGFIMYITKHVIERFQERITFEASEVVRFFIQRDIEDSEHMYQVNNIEKRIKDGVVYVLDKTNKHKPKVLTLYLLDGN